MLQNVKLLEGLTSDETTEVLIFFFWKTMTSHENELRNFFRQQQESELLEPFYKCFIFPG